MRALAGGSQRALRESNRAGLIEQLLAAPDGMTRPELAEALGLTVPAVANLISPSARDTLAAVVDERAASEDSLRARNSGPTPGVLHIDVDAGRAIGIELAHGHYRVVVVDLVGNVKADSELRPLNVEEDFHGALRQATLAACELAGVPPDEVLGIGLALAAPVHVFEDSTTGERRARFRLDLGSAAPTAPFRTLEPLEALRNHLRALPDDGEAWARIPLHADNDGNLGALAELRVGAGRDSSNLLFVLWEDGVGCGLILNGESYWGAGGIAGELGHIVLDKDNAVERCPRCGRPCLEATIAHRLRTDERGHGRTLRELVRDAVDGDPDSRGLVSDAARILGRGIAVMVTVLNPDRLVIAGPFGREAYARVIPPLQEAIDEDAVTVAARDFRATLGLRGRRVIAEGAAWLALDRERLPYLLGVADRKAPAVRASRNGKPKPARSKSNATSSRSGKLKATRSKSSATSKSRASARRTGHIS